MISPVSCIAIYIFLSLYDVFIRLSLPLYLCLLYLSEMSKQTDEIRERFTSVRFQHIISCYSLQSRINPQITHAIERKVAKIAFQIWRHAFEALQTLQNPPVSNYKPTFIEGNKNIANLLLIEGNEYLNFGNLQSGQNKPEGWLFFSFLSYSSP